MKNIVMLTLATILLTGCAATNFENKIGVDNNTFYSSKLPNISVNVQDSLKYRGAKKKYEPKSGTSGRSINVEAKKYYFSNSKKTTRLNITVERINQHNWRMSMPDYSRHQNLYFQGKETLSEKEYRTAIFAVQNEENCSIVKVYGTILGDSIRFQIFYVEDINNSWLSKNTLLTDKQENFLKKFGKRANKSFTIGEYDDSMVAPPATSTVSKQGAGHLLKR